MIEEKVFQRKRPVIERLIKKGFWKTPDGYWYETDFMEGEFRAVIQFNKNGKLTGQVIDQMNGEEYAPLRMESYNGAYVNTVRNAYEELLQDIADSCCTEMIFVAGQSNRIAGLILQRYGVSPDFPFGQSPNEAYGTFRHADNRKWFALIMNIKLAALLKTKNKIVAETQKRAAVSQKQEGQKKANQSARNNAGVAVNNISENGEEKENPDTRVDIVNLKILPEKCETLRSERGIYPAYHMNHVHWISVVLNDTVSDSRVMELIEESFRLTKQRKN